jgi:hypothetical protein
MNKVQIIHLNAGKRRTV